MIREALLADGDSRCRIKLVGDQTYVLGDVLTVLGLEGDWEVLELTEPLPEKDDVEDIYWGMLVQEVLNGRVV